MTTITLKINERSKAGKAFLAMTESFLKNVEGIEIVENLGNFDRVNEEQIHYNPEFVSKIKKAEANIKKGKTTRLNPDDIWGSIL